MLGLLSNRVVEYDIEPTAYAASSTNSKGIVLKTLEMIAFSLTDYS